MNNHNTNLSGNNNKKYDDYNKFKELFINRLNDYYPAFWKKHINRFLISQNMTESGIEYPFSIQQNNTFKMVMETEFSYKIGNTSNFTVKERDKIVEFLKNKENNSKFRYLTYLSTILTNFEKKEQHDYYNLYIDTEQNLKAKWINNYKNIKEKYIKNIENNSEYYYIEENSHGGIISNSFIVPSNMFILFRVPINNIYFGWIDLPESINIEDFNPSKYMYLDKKKFICN